MPNGFAPSLACDCSKMLREKYLHTRRIACGRSFFSTRVGMTSSLLSTAAVLPQSAYFKKRIMRSTPPLDDGQAVGIDAPTIAIN